MNQQGERFKMKCHAVTMVVLLFVLTAGVCFAEKALPQDGAYDKAKEQMADLLASEDCGKIEVSASSFDTAMGWIYQAVGAYLDMAATDLGGPKAAGEYGVEVLRGLNEHKVRYADQDGYDIVGDRDILIASEQDALDLGELLARVAVIVHKAHVGRGVNIQSAAKKVFESMAATAGANQGLISQYLTQMKVMSDEEEQHLIQYLQE